MVEEYIKLFTGYSGDFGLADMSKVSVDSERNKIKPDYEWAGRPVTSQDYQDHLSGKISIGIQACKLDKTAQFGCIDIDPKNYATFDIQAYLNLFKKYNLPLVPILSKSGGLHCYIFLKEAIPTVDLIEALKSFLIPLGLKPTTEVFPKQKELQKDDKGDTKPGNFINLPYYKNGTNSRYAINGDKSKLSLEAFLRKAKEFRIAKKDLDLLVEDVLKKILLGSDPEFADGPPCLALCSKGKLDDGRDRFMYNYMVFAKKKYKDKWPDYVSKANYNYLTDPWDKTKLDSKLNAWKGDTAGHTCYEEPIRDLCMRSLCYSKPFGVKSDTISSFPDIQDFEIIKYSEPEYRFNVILPNGDKAAVIVSNTKLMTKQTDVLNLIWEQSGIYYEPLKLKDWRAKLTQLRKGCTTVKPPQGTHIDDRLYRELYQYCVNGPQATKRSQLNSGACLTEKGYHYFRFESFLEYLPNTWKIPEEKIATKLKEKCEVMFDESINVDGKTLKVCSIKQMHVDKITYQPVERTNDNY